TPTRINKSHLVDLYERVSWAEPDRRFAARIVQMVYHEGDKPFRDRIKRLGGPRQPGKRILQTGVFTEIHRWVKQTGSKISADGTDRRAAEPYYASVRDFLKAASRVFAEAWGNDNYMVTKPVTLKGMLRVCADLASQDADPPEGRVERWQQRLGPWSER